MKLGQKKWLLLAMLAIAAAAAGWFRWYVSRPEYKVRALLNDVRAALGSPGKADRLLMTLRLKRRVYRDWPGTQKIADRLVALGPPAVPELIRAVDEMDWYYSPVAANALGRIGDARAAEPLARALESHAPFSTVETNRLFTAEYAFALCRLGDLRGYQAALKIEQHPSTLVIMMPFGKVYDRDLTGPFMRELDGKAVGPLIRCMDDPDPKVRSRALLTLSRIDGGIAMEAAAARLKDPRPEIRRGIAAAAAWLERPQRDELLREALQDEDESVRKAAEAALRQIWQASTMSATAPAASQAAAAERH